MTQKVILTKGIPGSGKSTWARKLCEKDSTYRRVNKDTIRGMYGAKHNPKNERMVEKLRDEAIIQLLLADFNVVVDDTNIAPKHIEHITNLVNEFDGSVEIEVNDSFLEVPFEKCVEQDKHRASTVGKDVVFKFWAQTREADTSHFNVLLPHAVLVDLDGTLALFDREKDSPYNRDWSKDTLNVAVAQTMQMFSLTHRIIILSARSMEHLFPTLKWLNEEDVTFHEIHMRVVDDKRDDREVKMEMFDAHIRGKYHVDLVLDDRPRIVRMWRHDLGLPVFQVAPDIEF